MAEKYFETNRLNKHYGGVHALQDIHIEVEKGEIHCLVGQNGCGKSTLIKILSGVVKPDEGSEITILNERMSAVSSHFALEKGISVIYQDLSLFPNLTVAENIAFGLHVRKPRRRVSWKRIEEVAKQALDKMEISLPLDATVESLPIAQRQLVAIARALALGATLLMMDEPTSSLTRHEVDILFSIIKDQQAKGITVLFISHRLDEVVEISDRISVMRDGKMLGTYERGSLNREHLANLIAGQNVSESSPSEDAGLGENILEVRELSRAGEYEDVSFTLRRGEILGITGLLGSGRTELALSLFGMTRPDKGALLVDGKRQSFNSNRDAIRAGIAYVPEDRLLQGLIMNQPIKSNIALTVIKTLRGLLGLLSLAKSRALATQWIDKLEIKSALPHVNASRLSGGNQQKVVIAKWLATQPRVLILDQPTNGIDVAAKSAIYEIIRDLAKNGMSILLISDEAQEIKATCTQALLMRGGRIIKTLQTGGLPEEALYEEVRYAQSC